MHLETVFEQAKARHGHACPGLYYGVSLALAALEEAEKQRLSLGCGILEGRSKCILDGVNTALAGKVRVRMVKDTGGCAFTLGEPQGNVRVWVREEVRRQVNALHEEYETEEYQRRGLEYLRGLARENLLAFGSLSPQEFERLSGGKESKEF